MRRRTVHVVIAFLALVLASVQTAQATVSSDPVLDPNKSHFGKT
jgi:hypothetical protein